MQKRGFKRSFRFVNMWTRHEGCEVVIKEGWENGMITTFKELVNGVKQCGDLLTKWNIEEFGNIQHGIMQKQKKLGKLLGVTRTNTIVAIDSCKK